MPVVTCPSCQRNLRVPEHMAGRQLICPRCMDAVEVPDRPTSLVRASEDPRRREPAPAVAQEQLSPAARLGVISLFLGALSIPVLCLPFVGYMAPGLSGVGLLAGLWGLFSAWMGDPGASSPFLASTDGGPRRFGQRHQDYPLAGIVVCLLTLTLALLPFLLR